MNLKNIERKDGWITYYYTFDYGYDYDFMIKYIESILKIDQFKVDRLLKAEMVNSPSVNCTEEFFKVNDIRKILSLKDECGRITLAGFSKKLNSLPIQISLYNQTNYLKIEHPEMNVMPSKDEITEYVSYMRGQAMKDKNEFKKMSIEDLEEYLKKENKVVSANYLKVKYVLGMKYWRKDRIEEGIKLLNEIKEYCEDNPNSNFINTNTYLGFIYYYGVCVEKDYKKSKEYFERAAKENDVEAINFLGVIYYNGQGVEKNYVKAREYFEKCANENDILAIYYLGRIYYYGEGIDKDYKKAKEYFEECAKENDIYAIYYLGRMYYYGEGVEKDYKKAREYFEKCANENHISGIHYLGLIYYYGKGIQEDYKKAKECFEKGAECGNLDSKYHLAQILYKEKKYNEARIIFEELAEKDDVEAIHYLGKIYYYGNSVEKNYKKAKEYFIRCCDIKFHIESIYYLGMMAFGGYGMKKDYLLAKECLELCAEINHIEAMNLLGIMYSTGIGVERDELIAKKYFERCANEKHFPSIYMLGLIYFHGRGVQKNLKKAKEYFKICAKESDVICFIIEIAKVFEKEKYILEANYYYEIVEKKVLDIAFEMLLILIKYDIKEQNCPYKTKSEENLLRIINNLNKDNEWVIMNDLGKLELISISKFLDKKLLNNLNQICDLNSGDYKIIKDRLIKKVNKYLESKKIEEKDLENTEKIIKEIIDNRI